MRERSCVKDDVTGFEDEKENDFDMVDGIERDGGFEGK